MMKICAAPKVVVVIAKKCKPLSWIEIFPTI